MAKSIKRGAIEIGKDVSVAMIEMDVQIGAMIACEWSIEDIALHFGLTGSAIRQRQQRYPHMEVIPKVASWVRIAVGKYIEDRLKAAEEDFKERKKRLQKKGYRMVEKVLDHGLDDSTQTPDPIHLRAAEMGIERAEGKPLDRKAILTRNENVATRNVDGDDLDAILNEAAQINEIRRPLLIAGARDAEVVGGG